MDERIAKIDALFAGRSDRPGAAVAVVADGHVVLEKGYGLASTDAKKPVLPSTQFLLASVTKQFTAMATLILVERGAIHLDDPLTRFFPEFPDYAKTITVRHLLHHTGGLPEYEDLFVQSGKVRWDMRASSSSPDPWEPTSRDALELLAHQPRPLFIAGTKWEYSNSGYVVLGQIIEKASGKRYRDYLREAIFEPLGMTSTVVTDETKPRMLDRAASYAMKDSAYVNVDYSPFNNIYGEDNVVSTVKDMEKWSEALNGEKLVPKRVLEQAFTSGTLDDGSRTNYGFGWSVGDRFGHPYQEHGGAWLGYRTMISRVPDLHFAVVVLANADDIDPRQLVIAITKICLDGKLSLPVARPVSRDALASLAGRYALGPAEVAEVRVEGNDLIWSVPHRDPLRLKSQSPTLFFVEHREDITFEFTGHSAIIRENAPRTVPRID